MITSESFDLSLNRNDESHEDQEETAVLTDRLCTREKKNDCKHG